MLLFGGPYSNLHALKALREQAGEIGIKHAVCTGDVVAYCAHPAETVAEIRDWKASVVAGNVERQLASGADDCGCGFEAGTVCDRLSSGWYPYARARISTEVRSWMSALPDILVFDRAGQRIAVIHGGVTDVARFIWSVSADHVLLEEIAVLEAQTGAVDHVVCGHSGIAFARVVTANGRTWRWTNAGVIGLPPNDGLPLTQFSVLHEDGAVSLHRLAYDADGAAAAIRETELPASYDVSLLSGWWPSEDVLPPELRRRLVSESG